jgi:hypothetical protein
VELVGAFSVVAHGGSIEENPPARLRALTHEMRQLDIEDPAFLLEAAALGEELEAVLATPDVLRETAVEIAQVARQWECSSVVGASSAGDRLAASVVTVDGALQLLVQSSKPNRVLVVDTVLVTGFNLRSSAELARSLGATFVVGCVVTAAVAQSVDGLDDIIVMER